MSTTYTASIKVSSPVMTDEQVLKLFRKNKILQNIIRREAFEGCFDASMAEDFDGVELRIETRWLDTNLFYKIQDEFPDKELKFCLVHRDSTVSFGEFY